MEKLREQLLEEHGVNCDGKTDGQVRALARVLNVECRNDPYIKEHKGARYVVVDSVLIPHKDPERAAEGKMQSARETWVRVEAFTTVLEDFLKARDLIHADEVGEE